MFSGLLQINSSVITGPSFLLLILSATILSRLLIRFFIWVVLFNIFNSFVFFKNCIIHQFEKMFFKIIFLLALYSYQRLFKHCVIHQFEKMLFENHFYLSSVFISTDDFRQAFWLNLMIRWYTFFNTNPWLSACSKFLICIKYFLLCKLAISFSTFSIFILSGKMVNQCEGYVDFQDIECERQENILQHNHRYSFL